MATLIEKLSKLAERTYKKHPKVDYGGCCVVAAHVAKYLSNRFETRIVSLQSSWGFDGAKDLDWLRENIDPLNPHDWEDNGVDFHHVFVEFKYRGKWWAYDSTEGPLPRRQFMKRTSGIRNKGYFTIQEATILADTPFWNPSFKRKKIPVIRQRIGRALGKYARC